LVVVRLSAADVRSVEPLFARVLGAAWHGLPREIREMHEISGCVEARGTASVARGAGVLSRLVALLAGFAPAATETPLTVRFVVRDGVETWTRIFGAHRFSTALSQGSGRDAGQLRERFGPFVFGIALVSAGGRLLFGLRGWSALRVPLPVSFAPRFEAYESVEGGRFHFYVAISHPFTGLIVRYEGSLSKPQPS